MHSGRLACRFSQSRQRQVRKSSKRQQSSVRKIFPVSSSSTLSRQHWPQPSQSDSHSSRDMAWRLLVSQKGEDVTARSPDGGPRSKSRIGVSVSGMVSAAYHALPSVEKAIGVNVELERTSGRMRNLVPRQVTEQEPTV